MLSPVKLSIICVYDRHVLQDHLVSMPTRTHALVKAAGLWTNAEHHARAPFMHGKLLNHSVHLGMHVSRGKLSAVATLPLVNLCGHMADADGM